MLVQDKTDFNGTEATGDEFQPETRQIKYSVSIFATDVEKDLVFIKEKYQLFSLRNIYPDFWLLFNKVKLLRKD